MGNKHCYECGCELEDAAVEQDGPFCSVQCGLNYEAEQRAEAQFQQDDFERRNTPKENR